MRVVQTEYGVAPKESPLVCRRELAETAVSGTFDTEVLRALTACELSVSPRWVVAASLSLETLGPDGVDENSYRTAPWGVLTRRTVGDTVIQSRFVYFWMCSPTLCEPLPGTPDLDLMRLYRMRMQDERPLSQILYDHLLQSLEAKVDTWERELAHMEHSRHTLRGIANAYQGFLDRVHS